MMGNAADVLVEAESFKNKGGWVVDQQFMDQMGSPYLLAHGMGQPVDDAYTEVDFPTEDTYYVYVRTFNWTSPWKDGRGPGKFALFVNSEKVNSALGVEGNEWMWQPAGKINIKKKNVSIRLHDLTGFEGRCDAIYFTTNPSQVPPSEMNDLATFRREKLQLPDDVGFAGKYDLVVIGGGVAGTSAAVSAARLGCKVALVNDRPVLGGNNSSEIRVHLGGRINIGPYPALGNLLKEFGPARGGNARIGKYYEDDKKAEIIANEKNITLYANYRGINVEMEGRKIKAVIAKHIESSKEIRLEASLFSDCTGDGTMGFLAGADYHIGREGRDEFGESTAPVCGDKQVMGASVQWYSEDTGRRVAFPDFKYGVEFNEQNSEKVTMGEWTWETGMKVDQIKNFEYVRDYGLLVVYSNWSALKNKIQEKEQYRNRKLGWVAFIAGKRESRRLLGDYILKEDDLRRYIVHEDATAATTWTIDLHYPDPKNTKDFPGQEFKSIAKHIKVHPYPVPYRCLYSRNIDNLFMAGRNISVTHVVLGTTRVMRTTSMMGEVVGMAASLCKKYQVFPRGIYWAYLPELKELMREGVGKKGLPDNQKYNKGDTLVEKPTIQ